jgi:hypothetical protein
MNTSDRSSASPATKPFSAEQKTTQALTECTSTEPFATNTMTFPSALTLGELGTAADTTSVKLWAVIE